VEQLEDEKRDWGIIERIHQIVSSQVFVPLGGKNVAELHLVALVASDEEKYSLAYLIQKEGSQLLAQLPRAILAEIRSYGPFGICLRGDFLELFRTFSSFVAILCSGENVLQFPQAARFFFLYCNSVAELKSSVMAAMGTQDPMVAYATLKQEYDKRRKGEWTAMFPFVQSNCFDKIESDSSRQEHWLEDFIQHARETLTTQEQSRSSTILLELLSGQLKLTCVSAALPSVSSATPASRTSSL
jgi:hypothetical protein